MYRKIQAKVGGPRLWYGSRTMSRTPCSWAGGSRRVRKLNGKREISATGGMSRCAAKSQIAQCFELCGGRCDESPAGLEQPQQQQSQEDGVPGTETMPRR